MDQEILNPEPQAEVTVKELEAMCEELATLRKRKDELDAELKIVNANFEAKKEEAQALLERCERSSYKGKAGNIGYYEETYVSLPQDWEKKQELFDYMKKEGIYEEKVTVNSQWLNGYVRKEMEAARERGDLFFSVPGVEVKPRMKINFRLGKGEA